MAQLIMFFLCLERPFTLTCQNIKNQLKCHLFWEVIIGHTKLKSRPLFYAPLTRCHTSATALCLICTYLSLPLEYGKLKGRNWDFIISISLLPEQYLTVVNKYLLND